MVDVTTIRRWAVLSLVAARTPHATQSNQQLRQLSHTKQVSGMLSSDSTAWLVKPPGRQDRLVDGAELIPLTAIPIPLLVFYGNKVDNAAVAAVSTLEQTPVYANKRLAGSHRLPALPCTLCTLSSLSSRLSLSLRRLLLSQAVTWPPELCPVSPAHSSNSPPTCQPAQSGQREEVDTEQLSVGSRTTIGQGRAAAR